MTASPPDLQAAVLARSYAEGLSPEDVVADVLDRVAGRGEDGIWIDVLPREEVLAAARDLLARYPDGARRPPLFGLPFAVKDNIDVAGRATTCACPAAARTAEADATVVARLRAAGALLVGKTNLDQFATGLVGTRSPYGIPVSPFDGVSIVGGSSSGCGAAVAAGLVTFAVGTDTAGSGRVPAALTNTVGLKPSRGLASTRGIVPACRSPDCPSLHAGSVADALAALAVAAGPDPEDPWSRDLPAPAAAPLASDPARWRVGVPSPEDITAHADAATAAAFAGTVARLRGWGAEVVPISMEPFFAAGDELYGGPWVAERWADLGTFALAHPEALHPVTRQVLATAARWSATDAFAAQHRMQEWRRQAGVALAGLDFLLTPTVPTTFTVEEVLADPLDTNVRMGRWTTYANLLDLAAVAVPAALPATGPGDTLRPIGVMLLGPAGSDAALAAAAAVLHAAAGLPVGATGNALPGAPSPEPPSPDPFPPGGSGTAVTLRGEGGAGGAASGWALLAVAGAHLAGLPLHPALLDLGGELVECTLTAPHYRMVALAGDVPRPGLIRTGRGGSSVEVEVYRLPLAGLGALLTTVAPPLAIGTVTLAGGRDVLGFVCEGYAAGAAPDVTEHGGWRRYLASAGS